MLLALLLGALLVPRLVAPQSPPQPAPPRARGWSDFPVFVWRETYAGKPPPAELVEPFGGVILMRDEDSAWARARGLSYLVWNVAGRDALHLDADEAWNARVEKWIETRDEGLLVREPCLNDPATIAGLHATLAATIAKHGEHPGLGFVLGDEVSLTPNGDPFDLCRCGHCEARWKAYAATRGLPERAPLTDEVRSALLEDDFSLLGPWLARRRFDQDRLHELLGSLAERARGTEERPLALLGLKGRTAFGGVDPFTAASYVDVLEGYPTGPMPAILEGLRESPPDLRRSLDWQLATLFLDGESPAGAAWLAWEHWVRGADSLVLWSDIGLERTRETTVRLGTAVEKIREVARLFPWHAHARPAQITLVVDDDSAAASWLRDALVDGPTWPRRRQGYQERNGTLERAIHTWLDTADELGLTAEAVPLARIRWAGASLLVLPQILVVGAEDVARLEAYLAAGGTLVIDGLFAWVDRSGQPWSNSVLEGLRRRAPERVHVASGSDARGLLAALRSDSKPRFTITGPAAERSWLVRSIRAHVGPPLEGVVLLPLAPTAVARAELSDLRLDVRSVWNIEWLHPPAGELLPAGDAAVFLLRPPDSPR